MALDNPEEVKSIIYTATEIAKADKLDELVQLLSTANIKIEQTDYDNLELLHLTGQEVKIKYNTLTSCHEEEKHMTRSSNS